MDDRFDILVLGSGEAGKYIAWSQASAGKRAAVIERRYVGGSCPNIACLPSKNVIHSARIVHYATKSTIYGLPSTSSQINITAMCNRKRAMVRDLVGIHKIRFRQTGTELIIGNGRFVGPKMIAVEETSGCERTLSADTIVVSTGSRARIDDIPGLREAAPLTHIELLEIGEVPVHLVILDGSSRPLRPLRRTPNTDNTGLKEAGIATTQHGFIEVDEHLRTSAQNVFAVGDCAGSPHFTHIAYDDFQIVRETLAGRLRSTKGRQLPYTLFTDPELAHVGLSESVAKAQSIPYRLAKLPMKAFLRTWTLCQEEGFAKALVSKSDYKILGFTALGVGAGELLPPVQVAMEAGLPYTSLANLIVTHPTLSEGLVYLFSSVPARA